MAHVCHLNRWTPKQISLNASIHSLRLGWLLIKIINIRTNEVHLLLEHQFFLNFTITIKSNLHATSHPKIFPLNIQCYVSKICVEGHCSCVCWHFIMTTKYYLIFWKNVRPQMKFVCLWPLASCLFLALYNFLLDTCLAFISFS